jgi:CubicO group peptidase (beta-lactamase class C family)
MHKVPITRNLLEVRPMLPRSISAFSCGFAVALVLALSLQSARAEAPAVCGAPAAVADGWQAATPQSTGLDAQRLCKAIEWLDGTPAANVHSVVVVRRGSVVFEHYRKGPDERWGAPAGDVAHGPDVKHDLRSISKSVTALLVGIAVDRKLIPSVDEPAFKYFPEYTELQTPAKERILIRHLLSMSAGLAWDENIPYTDPANSEIRMIRASDPYRYVWEQPVETAPGEIYNYSGGTTALLGRIVEKVSGQRLEAFARTALFEPLGITDFEWVIMPNGETAAASGVRLKPRDMAKLGQLFLTQGQWNGRQIVSPAWLRDSAAAHVMGYDLHFYGYQWWLGRSLVGQVETKWIAGFGLGGQRLFIVPDLDLVVVVTAGLYKSPMQRWVPLTILNRFVLAGAQR